MWPRFFLTAQNTFAAGCTCCMHDLTSIMVFSSYKKQRALALRRQGFKAPTIAKALQKEGLKASRRGLQKILNRFDKHRTIHRRVNDRGRMMKLQLTNSFLCWKMRASFCHSKPFFAVEQPWDGLSGVALTASWLGMPTRRSGCSGLGITSPKTSRM